MKKLQKAWGWLDSNFSIGQGPLGGFFDLFAKRDNTKARYWYFSPKKTGDSVQDLFNEIKRNNLVVMPKMAFWFLLFVLIAIGFVIGTYFSGGYTNDISYLD